MNGEGADRAALLALNAAHAAETSVLDAAALEALLASAFHVGLRGEGGRDGFLVAMDEGSEYDNANFQWYRSRLARFVYIDRVIVSASAQRAGHGRSLYEELFARARAAGQTVVGCEVNLEPPNPRSDRFHEALGFVEVGRAALPDRGKVVRYLATALEPGGLQPLDVDRP